jgi:hypothetical protein
MPSGFPGIPMILLISSSVAFACGPNDERASQRSMVSSVYRLKYGRNDSPTDDGLSFLHYPI